MAERGYCSRRKAEELIREGKVTVDGVLVTEPGFKAEKNAEIVVEGKKLVYEEKVYFLLNKPKNVISSAKDDKGRITVVDLIDTDARIYPLGRLDYDSSGLILLSNDGELMQKLIHPSHEVTKVYEVTVNKLVTKEEIERLERGVRIDSYVSAPAQIRLLRQNENKKTSFLEVSIHEGKNREIRKMFKTIGATVTKLNRIKEAGLELGDLRPGEYRRLKPYEVQKLKRELD